MRSSVAVRQRRVPCLLVTSPQLQEEVRRASDRCSSLSRTLHAHRRHVLQRQGRDLRRQGRPGRRLRQALQEQQLVGGLD